MNGMRDRWTMTEGPEAGNTLVVALLILFLLTSVGISYIAMTKGEKQIAGNQLAASQAFANAEAGISEALARMSNPNDAGGDYVGQQAGQYTTGWGVYIINDPGSQSLDPQYNATTTDGRDNDGDAAVDEASEHYGTTGSRNSNWSIADRLDYPWVKIRYKVNGAGQIVLFGDNDNNPTTPPIENTTRGIPKLIISSQGRRGVGSKIVTVEAVKWPLPPIPGSVYTEGPINFNGNAFYVDGHDHDYTAPYDTVAGAPSLLGIATPNDPNVITNALIGQQTDNVQGSGGDPSVGSANVNLDLPALAAAWSQMADITLAGPLNNPSTSGWGSVAPPPATSDLKIVHIAGDLHISGNASGAGVLVVDGDFDLSGTFNWNGVVLVLGDVAVTGGGTAKQVVGSMMVQGNLNSTSTMNGAIKLLYSSDMISQLNALSPYEVSSWIDQ